MSDVQACLFLQGQPLGCRCRATAGGAVTLLACPSCPSVSAREAQWWLCTGAVTELQPNGGLTFLWEEAHEKPDIYSTRFSKWQKPRVLSEVGQDLLMHLCIVVLGDIPWGWARFPFLETCWKARSGMAPLSLSSPALHSTAVGIVTTSLPDAEDRLPPVAGTMLLLFSLPDLNLKETHKSCQSHPPVGAAQGTLSHTRLERPGTGRRVTDEQGSTRVR